MPNQGNVKPATPATPAGKDPVSYAESLSSAKARTARQATLEDKRAKDEEACLTKEAEQQKKEQEEKAAREAKKTQKTEEEATIRFLEAEAKSVAESQAAADQRPENKPRKVVCSAFMGFSEEHRVFWKNHQLTWPKSKTSHFSTNTSRPSIPPGS